MPRGGAKLLAIFFFAGEWGLVIDHLGTPRVITKADGSVSGRHDYRPFGEEVLADYGGRAGVEGYPPSVGLRQQFTLKERDIETGLDYSGARYYGSTQGSFTSADQPFADHYVRNNPLIFIDPTGRFGDYYNRDGSWAYTDGINDITVYALNETRKADGSINLTPQLLPITHTEFTRSANNCQT
jgi:RHS repeat-associated protein